MLEEEESAEVSGPSFPWITGAAAAYVGSLC